MAILRHLHTHGRQTMRQVVAAVAAELGIAASTIENATRLQGRLIATDTSTKEHVYSLTPAGTYTAQHGHRPPRAQGRPPAEPSQPQPARNWGRNTGRIHYDTKLDHIGDTIAIRPGSQAAFALPSRMGAALHWPDGRVTDLEGVAA
jgi:hypothetical protein